MLEWPGKRMERGIALCVEKRKKNREKRV